MSALQSVGRVRVLVAVRSKMDERSRARPNCSLFPNFMIALTRVLRRPLVAYKLPFSSFKTYFQAMAVDASVPIHRGMEKLDRDAFKKTVKVVAAQISPAITNTVLKAPAMRGYASISNLMD